jgi:glycosyltransferase involved in cell wall biosynthesis
LVDDGSTDNTVLMSFNAGVDNIITNPIGSQYGDGFIAGLRKAQSLNAPWVLTIDAGGSYSPSDLPRLLSYWVSLGSRFKKKGSITGQSWWRKCVTGFAHWMMSRKCGDWFDYCGVRCFHGATITEVLLLTKRTTSRKAHIFNPQLSYLLWKNCTVHWFPVTYRATGSTLKPWGLIEVAWHMLKFWKGGL